MSRIAQLERLLSLDESDADVMYMLATERLKQGEHDEAVRWFDRCLGANPGYLYAHYHKAKALEAAGRKPDAIGALREGLRAATSAGDAKALGEISAYLESLGG